MSPPSHLPRPCCDLLILIRNTAPSFAMVRPGKDTPPLQQGMGTSVSMLESGSTHDGSVSPKSEEAKATPKRLRKREWTKPT